ncbi:RNA polymerase sigma-70 factor (ECF subfamily) [Dyadobacter jejuensis]|uniref:RNA polymerase sigma-70 factor (ECF subfamily) n=1 Tax=Dyadobacter jejuensis TaxID=1082580 RepID=A0A316AQM0_9BACT|nr:RNA polymerase sigma-70 factor [Dyadobacter jejuensis]PWJ59892.1 RNA polymerase sigma-70 factor (ECF subfamily) [Dyadobacter jejuensis]
MNFPSQQILIQVTKGDETAFSQLYIHFRTPAVKFCTSLLKDVDEAENVTQDVFAKIWDRRSQIKPDHSFQSYLFVSLRNQVFDQFKKLEKDQRLRQQYMENLQLRVEDETDDQEVHLQAIYQAIEALSSRRKLIFKLNFEEGKTYKEIAEYLNISTNTVKNQLIKAKQILREKMDPGFLGTISPKF